MRFAVGLIVASLFAAGSAWADDAGKQEYMVACAGCHGESALGDGPLSPLLNIATPNLTALSSGHGGEFPFWAVLQTIDGRDEVRAHGSAMPLWGERFRSSAQQEDNPVIAELIARGRMLSLAYYLESIQK